MCLQENEISSLFYNYFMMFTKWNDEMFQTTEHTAIWLVSNVTTYQGRQFIIKQNWKSVSSFMIFDISTKFHKFFLGLKSGNKFMTFPGHGNPEVSRRRRICLTCWLKQDPWLTTKTDLKFTDIQWPCRRRTKLTFGRSCKRQQQMVLKQPEKEKKNRRKKTS